MKKILSLALALVMCLSLHTGAPAQASGPVQISTAEELIAFAKRVNNGEYGLDGVLTADISLGVYEWKESIAAFDQKSIFHKPGYTGAFDGAGHRISAGISDYSIFGKIDTGGVVKNLTVNGIMHSRAMLAYCCAGTISNCHTSGSLFPTEDNRLPLIGGIVAELGCATRTDGYAPGTVVNCTSEVNIQFEPSVVNYGYYNIGGIVGCIHKGTADRCFFSGSIELRGAIPDCSASVGGIAGDTILGGPVINCGNTGSITADVFIDHNIHTKEIPVEIGGIVGHAGNIYGAAPGTASVVNCWSTGAIQVTSSGAPAGCSGIGGGRGGYSGGLRQMANCWSTGTVTAASDLGHSNQSGSGICYFLEGTDYNSGGSPTFTEEELRNGALTEKLNDYVRSHPGQGLLAWRQGPWGRPELTDSFTPEPAPEPTPDPTPPVTPAAPRFTDVKQGDFYYTAVQWAVEKGVTSGTSASTFSPNKPCTRAEIVTFLWNANGRPEPASSVNPFTDVKPADYYCKAVLWAVENHITSGIGPGRFGPKTSCTRSQAVTFLWRAAGSPGTVGGDHSFTDIKPGSYYEGAVSWAAANKVASGTSAVTFDPDRTCTRGQIVTFLYRANG